jgi:hypothetical protein
MGSQFAQVTTRPWHVSEVLTPCSPIPEDPDVGPAIVVGHA